MSAEELNEKLKQINEAMEKAQGDPQKEAKYLDALIDPADATACEGCQ
jgi:hypothetical protein